MTQTEKLLSLTREIGSKLTEDGVKKMSNDELKKAEELFLLRSELRKNSSAVDCISEDEIFYDNLWEYTIKPLVEQRLYK